MTNHNETRVVLIGGSSHVGKSTLGRGLASALGWDVRSTDKMARHPGFPWVGLDGMARPDFVREHYRALEVEEPLADVLVHYEKNVWPQVVHIADEVRSQSDSVGVVIEGSALWPGSAGALGPDRVKAVWLTASDALFRERIYRSSRFEAASAGEQFLIQKFLDRTLLYNRRMREKAEELNLLLVDVEKVGDAQAVLKRVLGELDGL